MSNWSNVGHLEQTVRSSTDTDKINAARLLLLHFYEELLLNDLVKATERNIDERLWSLVYYKHIEACRSQLRASPKKAPQTQLASLLLSATAFFTSLIIELEARGDLDLIELAIEEFHRNSDINPNHDQQVTATPHSVRWRSLAFACINRCWIYLGDLARYQDNIDRANSFYRKCITLSPSYGKPYSQLAIISLSKQEHLDSIYWFSLAWTTSHPFAIARENLAATINRVLQSGPTIGSLSSIISFYKLAYVVVSERTPNLVLEHANTVEYVESAIDAMDYTRATKVLVLLMVAMHELDNQFASTDKTAIKSRIRSLQVVIVSVIIGIMSYCLTCITDGADTAECQPLQEFIIKASLDGHHPGHLHLIQRYGPQVEGFGADRFTEILLAFCYPVANVMNAARSVLLEDDDQNTLDRGDEEVFLLPEDADLLGFVGMSEYYRRVNRDVFKQYLHNLEEKSANRVSIKMTIQRLGRLHLLTRRLAHDERFEMLKYDAKDGFLVMDDETKQRMRTQQSEALGKQFQNQQIEEAKKSARPVVIVDAGVLVDHLWMVKKWLSRGTCFVVIAKEVLEQLDRMKKGTSEQSINARAATRFLELKTTSSSLYWRQFLRLQAPHETDTTDPYLPTVSKYERGFISCAAYFSKQVLAQPFNTEEMFRVIYTDERIRAACDAYHLPSSTLVEWDVANH
ncbi:hypothetical protein SeMB42_g06470 [Synchytrium endobioticum]|uniref:PIN domain-containing protein n=1 Tax=Synchytrium endobioticum TaxID=286115 RepID=A0A507DH93_9FUNG|nr:hypothetical protein SeMB42_g06470 [Synchytrium endobioticum]TPX50685.1 hypothetical protein SeLEV6574_g00728 [Synchytrium endobioticum]